MYKKGGLIPFFILVSDGKYRDSNILDILLPVICTYLVVAHVKHSLKSELSIYEIIQIFGISALDKTTLQDLFTEPKSNQNTNEQMNLFSD